MRLQWLGGTVKPSGRKSEVTGRRIKSLLIPFKDSQMCIRDRYKLADYKRVYDNGYSPTRLSGLAVTNNPDHEAQPGIIRQSLSLIHI